MNCAGIDIGTNTILMAVGRRQEAKADSEEATGRRPKATADVNSQWSLVNDFHRIPRLGEGINSTGVISDDALNRTIDVLVEYRQLLVENNVEHVRAVATAAMRNASNAIAVKQKLEEALGHEIEIIDGATEGRLTFLGTVGNSEEEALLIDIGGGSTEFVWGVNGNVRGAVSLNIGVVNLTEEYVQERPLSNETVEKIASRVKAELDAAFEPLKKEDLESIYRASESHFVGVAGTPTALAQMAQGLREFDRNKVDGYVLHQAVVSVLSKQLSSFSMEQLHRLPGIDAKRADVLPVGSLILHTVMARLDVRECTANARGLRFGVLMTAK